MRPRPAAVITVIATIVATVSLLATQNQSRQPNILLIVADDLGYGDLAVYGATDTKTPRIDKLAAEGVRFTQFYANSPVCTPTRAALITGRYPQRVLLERQLGVAPRDANRGLPATDSSLPNLLRRAGYSTGLIGKWHLGFKAEFHPNRHGFGYFWGYLAGFVDWYRHVRADGEHDLYENAAPTQASAYLGHEITERAVNFIRQNAQRPFFLEVAYGAPHAPHQSPFHAEEAVRAPNGMLQTVEMPTRRDYVEIVEDLDSSVGLLLDALDKASLTDRTIVVFVSDNGPIIGPPRLGRVGPLYGSKGNLFEGGIRVPAILRWPGHVPAGSISSQVAITFDLTETFLSIAGVGAVSRRHLEGMDLLPGVASGAAPSRRTLFWRVANAGGSQRAVRQGRFKLLSGGRTMVELFDLAADPGEQKNLAAEHPQQVAKLQALLKEWEKDVDADAKQGSSGPVK